MTPFAKHSLEDFLAQLGSERAIPGGGAAAGLTAAMAISLLEMVVRINLKRAQKTGKRVNAQDRATLQSIVKTRRQLLTLIDADAKGFEKVSTLYKTSKDKPAFQAALKNAAKAPARICELLTLNSKKISQQKNNTSRWLMSDLKESALLSAAAFHSARFNVVVNLDPLKDQRYSRMVKKNISKLEKTMNAELSKVIGTSRG